MKANRAVITVMLLLALIAPISTSLPQVEAQSTPESLRTWRPNLWSWRNSSPEGRKILEQLWNGVEGRQSFHLGAQVISAAVAGNIKRYVQSCEAFTFEWFDIDVVAYTQDTIWITANEKGDVKRVSISPPSQKQGLYACDGVATLGVRVKPSWAKPDMSYAVTVSPRLRLRYPKGHTLWSCGPATLDSCAAEPQSPTVSYRATQRAGVTDLHFVVDD